MCGGTFIAILCLLATGISSKLNQRNDETSKRSHYEEYLDKLSRVETFDDLKREFKIPERLSYKREEVPWVLYQESCSISDKIEKIPYSSATTRIVPTCHIVKRCNGCCTSPEKECLPTQTTNKTAKVAILDNQNIYKDSHEFVYEDHVQCQCQCKRKSTECKSNQQFNSNNCLCSCPSSAQTTCGDRKQWSSFECGCVCSQKDPQCPPGHVWNTETCLCEAVVQPTCSKGTVFNSALCKCKIVV